jgi:hypothetical protein
MNNNQLQQNTHEGGNACCAGFSSVVNDTIYSDEEIANITELGDILQEIRKRLIIEGLSIEDLRKSLN